MFLVSNIMEEIFRTKNGSKTCSYLLIHKKDEIWFEKTTDQLVWLVLYYRDYKIIAFIFALRLQTFIAKQIDNGQSASNS